MAFSVPEKIEKKARKTISKFYEVDSFKMEAIELDAAAHQATATDFEQGKLFKVHAEGQFLGYGFIGNAPSKTATYDYLVLFDQDWIITKSKVLVYREEYGGEIGSKRWLKQFVGGRSNSHFAYEQDIIPISGATISVRSMTNSINQLLESLGWLDANNRI